MNQRAKESLTRGMRAFNLPRYDEISDVGLYLEQTATYVTECLAPLEQGPFTGSMISNYVKKGLIPSPVRRQYTREQIAQLIFIAVAKPVVSIDNLRLMLSIQRDTYKSAVAYDYMREELKNVLDYVFGFKESLSVVGVDATDEKFMLRNVIITAAHKIYLDKLCAALQQEEA